jgi:predicted  nucleic acid-binding Zn-ribbon protein
MEVVYMKIVFILLILLMIISPAYAATIYKWVDKDGVVNYSDDYNKVPTLYHGQVEELDFFTERGPSVQTPQTAAGIKQEMRADIYGRDETWWKEKVSPWKKQLEEATSNYERTHEEFMKKAEGLIRYKFGSKTQYQMISYDLGGLTERMKKYRAQIAEAEEMLDGLLIEAEKAKANPEWLEPGITPTAQEIASSRKEEADTDLYGRDETWWKEKVRPWKKQLEEATQNYEKAHEELIKQGEGLGTFRFGRLSLTQYQMVSHRLEIINKEMETYQGQIAEAKEMLSKLSQEAQETNANPAWLE